LTFLFFYNGILQAQWVQTNGPAGGQIQCMGVNGNDLFVSCAGTGMFVTTNNGKDWKLLDNGLPHEGFNCIIFNDSNILVGADSIYISTNNGKNWTSANSGLSGTVYSLGASGSNIFAATTSGVYLSTNNGTNWTSTGLNFVSRSLVIFNTNIIAATYTNGMFRSTNNGTTWTSLTNGPLFPDVSSFTVSGDSIYSCTYNTGVYLSTDSGENWTKVFNDLATFYIPSIAIKENKIFAVTDKGIYLSTDKGLNWIQQNNGMRGVGSGHISVNGNYLFADNIGGLYMSSDNGANWTAIGPPASGVMSICVSDTNIFAASQIGVYLTTNKGASWTETGSGIPLTNNIMLLVKSGNNIFAGTSRGVYVSTNKGTSWMPAGLQDEFIYSLSGNDNYIFAGTFNYNGVFRSSDNGLTWTQVNGNVLMGQCVNTLFNDGDNIFAGTSSNGIFRSTNDGTSWTQLNRNNIGDEILAFTAAKNILLATSSARTFRSTNNGTQWIPIKSFAGEIPTFAVSGSNFFASTPTGVYLSKDNGENWKQFNEGLTTIWSGPIAVMGTDIFCGIPNYGVWKRSLSDFTTSVEVDITIIPKKINLDQNFPNPFNPSTQISYSLPSVSMVKLVVYNTLGQTVKVLENSFKNAGNYSVNFNAADLPSGIYFYRLEAGQFSQVKKMMLVK
jgi:hypothetical protein